MFQGFVIWKETAHAKETWSTNSLHWCLPFSCWRITSMQKGTE